jgi:peptide/nickel transport system substrate-binding protein
MYRKASIALLSVAVLLAAAGCASTPTEVNNDTLDLAWNAQPPTLDPLVTTSVVTRDIMRNVFEGLVTIDKENQIQPMLASEFSVNDNYTEFTFTLRDDISFHDGTSMTVEDVVASMDRWMTTTSNGKQYFTGAVVSAPDASTLVITTPAPLFTGLNLLADDAQIAAIQPKTIVDAASATGVEEYVGTGPYEFGEWKTDSWVSLHKFDKYKPVGSPSSGLSGDKSAPIQEIIFHFVPDPSTRIAGLQSGEYDGAIAIPFDSAAAIESDPSLTSYVSNNGFNAAIFNKQQGVFADQAMRHAVYEGLNLEDIQTAAFSNPDFFSMNGALMTKEQKPWYSEESLSDYNPNDQDKAKKMLADAGYADEEVRILTSREYDDHYNGAVVLQEQLVNLGVNATLNVVDWATVLQNRTDPAAYEIFITGFPSVAVPNSFVFLSSTWPGWTDDAAISTALQDINASTNEDEAAAASAELQAAYFEYLPIIKYGDKKTITALRADVKGYDFQTGDIFWNATR